VEVDGHTDVYAAGVATVKVRESTTEATVNVPFIPVGDVIPFTLIVGPLVTQPCGMSVVMVITEFVYVTLAISLFGQKRVPEDHRRPFPD
jgi:hypothetical protein